MIYSSPGKAAETTAMSTLSCVFADVAAFPASVPTASVLSRQATPSVSLTKLHQTTMPYRIYSDVAWHNRGIHCNGMHSLQR